MFLVFFRKKNAVGSRVLQETKEDNADEYLPIENTFKTWRLPLLKAYTHEDPCC